MELIPKQEPNLMPKIRCPKCEKSNMYRKNNMLYCPECGYKLKIFPKETKKT